jgi:inositol 1,4,5-triphosphate receptor type 1/inositol 1,4,5-triphosphate receptor type 3
VFGIIIDTFAELRDQRNLVLEDIHSKCYICGQDRSLIEMKGTGWSYHFMCEHSAFAYLSFMVYIWEKKTYDCCGLEKHVKERLEKNDASFMPATSLAILERDD